MLWLEGIFSPAKVWIRVGSVHFSWAIVWLIIQIYRYLIINVGIINTHNRTVCEVKDCPGHTRVCNHSRYSGIYEVCLEKLQPLLIWEWFVQHQYNQAAKESRLECAHVNTNKFTALVSGGSRCSWASMCAVWPLHSKWARRAMNLH